MIKVLLIVYKQPLDAKYEGISKNNRVRLPDKDEEDVSDGEIDDDVKKINKFILDRLRSNLKT